jgi:isopenicillin N synthase-like dioxygenase
MAVGKGETIAAAPKSHGPLANLDTITFSKLLDRNPEQVSKLLSACENVGFFYLDISDQYSATMLENLEGVNRAMREWFAQPESVKRKYLAISMASHGLVITSLL